MRANRVGEVLTAQRDAESKRHNIAGEGETRRHNQATEGLTSRSLDITSQYNQGQLDLRAKELLEKERAAKAQESLTARGQDISSRNASIAAAATRYAASTSAAASRYATDINAANVQKQIAESHAQKLVEHGLEQQRINVQSKQAQTQSKAQRETSRHNVQTESEANRHNVVTEKISLLSTASKMVTDAVKASTLLMGGL
nr:putative ORF1 [Marmot picobirnavirus]